VSSNRLRKFLKALGVSPAFEDYGINNNDLKKLKVSLENSQRVDNSFVKIKW
jgi:hypothetical protein